MNILLICNKKNLLGNKLVIDSTLYCNDGVTFFILLTEDIGDHEKQNIKNLVKYLDHESSVYFEENKDIKNIPIEDYFYFLDHLLYLSADTLVTQTIEYIYETLEEDTKNIITLNKIDETFSELRHPIIFFNFKNIREYKEKVFINHNNFEITELSCNQDRFDYFIDSRIGFKGIFSFNFNMPIIFWFTNDNKKIYEMNTITWCELYPDFEPMVKQIYLSEMINF